MSLKPSNGSFEGFPNISQGADGDLFAEIELFDSVRAPVDAAEGAAPGRVNMTLGLTKKP